MKESSLQLHDVSFRIGGRRILSGVNLELRSGELTAVIGPSGSGKSTLIKCLSTTYRPSSGAVRFDGAELDTVRSAYRQRLGYVPQDDVIHRELRVETACRYAARLRLDAELSDTDIDERVRRVLEALGLGEHRRKRIRNLSGGQRKRVNIGVELLADPDVLLLDEPASGLDPGTEEDLVGCLKQLAGAGKIIVKTTHSMVFLEEADRILLLMEGELIFAGNLTELLHHFEIAHVADVFKRLRDETAAHWQTKYKYKCTAAGLPRRTTG